MIQKKEPAGCPAPFKSQSPPPTLPISYILCAIVLAPPKSWPRGNASPVDASDSTNRLGCLMNQILASASPFVHTAFGSWGCANLNGVILLFSKYLWTPEGIMTERGCVMMIRCGTG